ncbi:MAG: hypothetical protein R8G66_21380 [Cytophagales bacterium]|nr:hypothetical protein [Cytophagales bacterium]
MAAISTIGIYAMIANVAIGSQGSILNEFIPIWLATILTLLFLIIMIITLICFFAEKGYAEGKSEWFYDDLLFQRYGQLLKNETIPIGVKNLSKNSEELARNLYYHLSQSVKARFGTNQRFSSEIVKVIDSHLESDARLFLKIKLVSMRNSQISYFVNLDTVGKQLAINTRIHLRNKYAWHQVLLFVVTSPLTYWLWIYHWLLRKYFIRSEINNDLGNAFEKMDLESYIKLATFTIMVGIEEFAKANDLLTEELKQLIINNINNSQSINISKSRSIRISGMRYKIRHSA